MSIAWYHNIEQAVLSKDILTFACFLLGQLFLHTTPDTSCKCDFAMHALPSPDTTSCWMLQYYYPMSDGSGLRLTVQKYLTPNQYDISQAGGLPADKACTDFPRMAMAGGPMDACISAALQQIGEQNSTASVES